MKRNWLPIALIFVAMVTLVLQPVAGEEPAELKGEVVKIQDIVKDEPAFDGKMVVIEGNIVTECPSGCWFIVHDQTASIYVDILPSDFVIPQKTGSEAKVYGKVTSRDGDPMIIGKMVEIGGEIYQ
jgi:uncharacterized protein YdeI (BOF family)